MEVSDEDIILIRNGLKLLYHVFPLSHAEIESLINRIDVELKKDKDK